ncbi:DDE-type integrase/transposase/recombinase [Kangiella sp. TOML190]|uniref:Mu transposase domain-containing protein n=1 Tax=Kangiella sp. TOML190 TaxID=2931351 RepID=UPI00203B567C|nr:DDE-type integrase/transposase/recombinase [Kangiella sp. TOML190]
MKKSFFNTRKMIRLIDTTNLSNRKIALEVEKTHPTVSKYRRIMISNKLTWDELKNKNDDAINAIFNNTRGRDESKRLPHFEHLIKEIPKKGATYQIHWEEYYEVDPATAYGKTRFIELCHEYEDKHDITMTIRRYPGEIINVDFAGLRIPYKDKSTGKQKRAHIFVAACGVSQLLFIAVCVSQQKSELIDALNKMIVFYGGVSQVVISDNLKAAVDKAKGKNPAVINRHYDDWAEHNGTHASTSRAATPQDNAVAEAGVNRVTCRILYKLRSMSFNCLEDIESAALLLLEEINNEPFKGGECRREIFEKVDKPALSTTPEQLYEFYEWLPPRKVPRKFMLNVEGHLYSVPYKLKDEHVETKYNHKRVKFIHKGIEVATHKRSFVKGDFSMTKEHQPLNYQIYGYTKQDYLEWASTISKSVIRVVNKHFEGYEDYSKIPRDACSYLRKLYEHKNTDKELFVEACKYALDRPRPLFFTNIERLMKTQPWVKKHKYGHIKKYEDTRIQNIQGGYIQ